MNTLKCIGILHPAHILRGKWGLEPAQVMYLKRVKQVLDGTHPPILDPNVTPANFLTAPTLRDLDIWAAGGNLKLGVTCDIEAAGDLLVAIGFCRLSDLACVCVPFRRAGGAPYWERPEDAVMAARWCAVILESLDVPLIFHNGSYDVTELRKYGFVVRGWVDDTMVMVHTAYPEFPKRLGFLGSLVGMPEWKQLAKADDTTEDKE